MDVVVYRRDFPKLNFGGGLNAYLAESVVATIEVKSTLDSIAVLNATKAARRLKSLERHLTTAFMAGYHPPNILSFIVAYAGPAKMETVRDWVNAALVQESIANPQLPPTYQERLGHSSPALDGVFILGKGFLLYDNQVISFMTDEHRAQHPDVRLVFGDSPDQNLLLLFLILTVATSGVSGSWLDPRHYVPELRTTARIQGST